MTVTGVVAFLSLAVAPGGDGAVTEPDDAALLAATWPGYEDGMVQDHPAEVLARWKQANVVLVLAQLDEGDPERRPSCLGCTCEGCLQHVVSLVALRSTGGKLTKLAGQEVVRSTLRVQSLPDLELARGAPGIGVRVGPEGSDGDSWRNVSDYYRWTGTAFAKLFSFSNSGSGDGPDGGSTTSRLVVCRDVTGGVHDVEILVTQESHDEKGSSESTSVTHYAWGAGGFAEVGSVSQCLPADMEPSIAAFLDQWRNDWEGIAGTCGTAHYEAHYAPTFVSARPRSFDRKAWLADKKAKACKKKYISVLMIEPKVKRVGADEAEVTFEQDYSSDGYRDTGKKTLHLVRTKGRWQVTAEDWDG